MEQTGFFTDMAIDLVYDERERQSKGDYETDCASVDVDLGMALGVLMEEVGEFSEAMIERHGYERMREEAVQVSAVALAIVEGLSRRIAAED